MNFLPEWLPNVHPLVIHFPIVLIIVAVVLNLVQIFRPNGNSIWIFYLFATLSAIVALISGENGSELLSIPDNVFPLLNSHSDWAHRAVYAIGLTTLISFFGHFKLFKYIKVINIFTLFIGFISIFFIFETAEHGGELVYKYNIGTNDNNQIHNPSNLDSINQNNEIWLEINSTDSPFIISIDSLFYESLSITVELNEDKFNGDIEIIHHFQDNNNYDFMRIKSSQTLLGRMENGNENILNSKSIEFKEWAIWKCFADGRHFRGFLNGKMVTHGHIAPLPSGKTFIQFNGKGKIGIKNIVNNSIKK